MDLKATPVLILYFPLTKTKIVWRQFNHVDTMRGFNSHEMARYSSTFLKLNIPLTRDMAQGVLATNLKQYDDLDKAKVFKLLMSEYIMAATDPDSLFKQTLQAVDDINFIGPTMKELDWAAPRGGGLPTDRPTFLYQFDYRDSGSPYPQKWITAEHTDEIKYVFNVSAFSFCSVATPRKKVCVFD